MTEEKGEGVSLGASIYASTKAMMIDLLRQSVIKYLQSNESMEDFGLKSTKWSLVGSTARQGEDEVLINGGHESLHASLGSFWMTLRDNSMGIYVK